MNYHDYVITIVLLDVYHLWVIFDNFDTVFKVDIDYFNLKFLLEYVDHVTDNVFVIHFHDIYVHFVIYDLIIKQPDSVHLVDFTILLC